MANLTELFGIPYLVGKIFNMESPMLGEIWANLTQPLGIPFGHFGDFIFKHLFQGPKWLSKSTKRGEFRRILTGIPPWVGGGKPRFKAWDGSGAALQWFWLMHPEAWIKRSRK